MPWNNLHPSSPWFGNIPEAQTLHSTRPETLTFNINHPPTHPKAIHLSPPTPRPNAIHLGGPLTPSKTLAMDQWLFLALLVGPLHSGRPAAYSTLSYCLSLDRRYHDLDSASHVETALVSSIVNTTISCVCRKRSPQNASDRRHLSTELSAARRSSGRWHIAGRRLSMSWTKMWTCATKAKYKNRNKNKDLQVHFLQ